MDWDLSLRVFFRTTYSLHVSILKCRIVLCEISHPYW